MHLHRGQKISFVLLSICFLLIQLIRSYPAAGEYYARHIYPEIALLLSGISGLFPFSLGDCFIVISCISLLIYLFYSPAKTRFCHRIINVFLFVGWIYVWFYFAWGLNYFRENFYERNQIPYIVHSPDTFKEFLHEYVIQLNNSYTASSSLPTDTISREIQKQYARLTISSGLASPQSAGNPKPMLFSTGMSKVGVSGYMGPFFSEYHLNRELLPEEYPAVYAHELAHRLSVSSEAEANFYAWLCCTNSGYPAIRYSGNFLILGYIVNNAARLLSEEEFQEFVHSIRPEIIAQYKACRKYWQSKYSPFIGKIQNRIYNLFLKSNRIPSGTKNYSEVIGMIISWKTKNGELSLQKTELQEKEQPL